MSGEYELLIEMGVVSPPSPELILFAGSFIVVILICFFCYEVFYENLIKNVGLRGDRRGEGQSG